ncbi:MAG: hypothetical protein M3Z37_08050 [Candidatus Eremiobacteraeota bacterium]|nr:hypothetical protein [Candidatus Eremiobacteraeota bacterium]
MLSRVAPSALFVAACLLVTNAGAAFSKAPAPPKAAPGGSHQRAALAGCLNEWLFNGIWRVKVTSVGPIKTPPDTAGNFNSGWGVTVQFRNGTNVDLVPSTTGMGHLTLVAADGDTMDIGLTTSGTMDAQKLGYHDFPPSAQYTHQLTFLYPYGTAAADIKKPVKFLITFDASIRNASSGPHYSTSSPSMRIDLTCKK